MFDTINTSIATLSAMITPAVLISACGSVAISTSNRLGRVVDRVRTLSEIFEGLTKKNDESELSQARREMFYDQLNKLTSRASLLQRSLTMIYLAIAIFIATSVSIGIFSIWFNRFGSVSVVLGLTGALFLLYGSVLLIFEARLAVDSTYREMNHLRLEIDGHYNRMNGSQENDSEKLLI